MFTVAITRRTVLALVIRITVPLREWEMRCAGQHQHLNASDSTPTFHVVQISCIAPRDELHHEFAPHKSMSTFATKPYTARFRSVRKAHKARHVPCVQPVQTANQATSSTLVRSSVCNAPPKTFPPLLG